MKLRLGGFSLWRCCSGWSPEELMQEELGLMELQDRSTKPANHIPLLVRR
jgi:hypothetical protein